MRRETAYDRKYSRYAYIGCFNSDAAKGLLLMQRSGHIEIMLEMCPPFNKSGKQIYRAYIDKTKI